MPLFDHNGFMPVSVMAAVMMVDLLLDVVMLAAFTVPVTMATVH
ncbi:hypothetical protein [Methylobacterium iners]|uniref:Uncharacterized protein n=1 Tax=Methylobacterium iners TaxID=418707 RepID=A0ABQ4RXR6_9HYPH|nr:hypothetical protein [Methylobacterium iners]GJD94499.1 hypothetical protein OCOJLMKI_1701 [Methylobacterium iners]